MINVFVLVRLGWIDHGGKQESEGERGSKCTFTVCWCPTIGSHKKITSLPNHDSVNSPKFETES